METIGLIAAMTQESDALLRCVKPWKRVAVGPLRGNSFVLAGQNYVLVTSGMGVRRASEAARNLVELNSPQMLISFGIAGAVEADLEIGDVVLAEAVCSLDQVLVTRDRQLFIGTAVTTGGSQVMKSQLGEMRHPILEMETAGIAQVAAEKGIPLLSLRAISDGPHAPIPFDLGEIMDEDANLQAGRLLKTIVRNPRIILQSMRMTQNIRIATNNAAAALVAALRQADFGQTRG
jgi:adenosylhomocysteine nucleosidase